MIWQGEDGKQKYRQIFTVNDFDRCIVNEVNRHKYVMSTDCSHF